MLWQRVAHYGAARRVRLRKHGVSFEEAETAFADDLAAYYPDTLHEARFVLLGYSQRRRLLYVVHAEVKVDSIRIISARKATKPMSSFPLAVALALAVACDAESPPRGPEETCFRVCEARATQCSRHECARGCNLVLDRLVEHEGDHVLGCVARAKAPCDDHAWAHCAALIGVHADGGPPAPPPPSDDLEN